MAEPLTALRGTVRKHKPEVLGSRTSLNHGNTSLGSVNTARLSLMSSARLQKLTSNSLEKLSFISEKEDSDDFNSYHIEYSTYLLRKAQNRILSQNKEEKEENVRKCFVSLKLELEGLLNKFVELSKEIGYLKIFFETLRENNKKIEEGNKIVKTLKENQFESLMRSLSQSLDHTINQLQLVDVEKSSLEEAFRKKIWGPDSEMEKCLIKIDDIIAKNKTEMSNIAGELIEIKKLSSENAMLRERFCSVFEKLSNEILETNYKQYTGIVRKAFDQRQDSVGDYTSQDLNFDFTEYLQALIRHGNEQCTFQLSKLDYSYAGMPNSASTPQN